MLLMFYKCFINVLLFLSVESKTMATQCGLEVVYITAKIQVKPSEYHHSTPTKPRVKGHPTW